MSGLVRERINSQPCGCQYDTATEVFTHQCTEHGPRRRPRNGPLTSHELRLCYDVLDNLLAGGLCEDAEESLAAITRLRDQLGRRIGAGS